MIDPVHYITIQAHVSGPNNIWNTHLWKSFGQYTSGPIYDPINYFYKYNRGMVFFRNMLIKRQRVLLVSSIESQFRIHGPFSHLFLTSAWIGGALTNYRKVHTKLRYFGIFIDVLYYLESTQQKMLLTIYSDTALSQILLGSRKFIKNRDNKLQLSTILSLTAIDNTILTLDTCKYPQTGFFNLQYSVIHKILQNVTHFTYFHFLQLYLSIYCFKLSFIVNAKHVKTIENSLELVFQVYNITGLPKINTYINNIFYLELFNHYLKLFNIIKFKKQLYHRPGSPYLRIKKSFPAINIALDLRLANMYILNESRRLYLPLLSFHKSDDPANGPVYVIPAHIATKKQVTAFGSIFLGYVLKAQIMDLQQLLLWKNSLSWRN